MDRENQPNPEELKKLAAALRGLEKERVFVPGAVDERVLNAVTVHFAAARGVEETGAVVKAKLVQFGSNPRRLRGTRRVRNWQKWLPLAASIAIAAIMVLSARMGRLAPGDINGDGIVDVVDAFAVAERVASGERTSRSWDVNRDGRVDAGDSNEILARAVDLERSGS